MRNRFWLVIAVAVVVILGIVAVGLVMRSNKAVVPATQAPSQQQNTSPATPTTYPVKVFFSKHPDSDNDPSLTFALDRVSPNLGVGVYAIKQLVAGPTSAEVASGYFSNLALSGTSDCSGADFSLAISGSTATLRFCRDVNLTGVMSDAQIEMTIKATLTQFSTVKKVVILNRQNDCLFNASGMNLCK